jgi:hypothetical protein
MIIESKEEIKTKLDDYFRNVHVFSNIDFLFPNYVVILIGRYDLEFYEPYKNAEDELIELNKSIFKNFDWMIYSIYNEYALNLSKKENYQEIIFEILCDVLRVSNLREFQ